MGSEEPVGSVMNLHPSPKNYVVEAVDTDNPEVIDLQGNSWKIDPDGTVSYEGQTVQGTRNIVALGFDGKDVWCRNLIGEWDSFMVISGHGLLAGEPTEQSPFRSVFRRILDGFAFRGT